MRNIVEPSILRPGRAINLHILSQELKGAVMLNYVKHFVTPAFNISRTEEVFGLEPCETLLVNSYCSEEFRGEKLGFLQPIRSAEIQKYKTPKRRVLNKSKKEKRETRRNGGDSPAREDRKSVV